LCLIRLLWVSQKRHRRELRLDEGLRFRGLDQIPRHRLDRRCRHGQARIASGCFPRGKILQTLKGAHTVRRKIRVLSMLGLSLALLGCGSGNDYGDQTGYDYLPRCKLVVRGPRTEREIVSATYCVGAVTALVGVAPLLPPRYRFCFPDDVTAGEAVQVVVAYLESNLSRLHEDFRQLAITAMRQAWPCK
jgi:hypothetical protein